MGEQDTITRDEAEAQEVAPLTRAQEEAIEDGRELAARLQAEQEARPDDHELVVSAEEYAEATAPAEGEGEAPPEPPLEGDYEDATVPQLQAELSRRGLAKGGNKDELVERLYEDDDK